MPKAFTVRLSVTASRALLRNEDMARSEANSLPQAPVENFPSSSNTSRRRWALGTMRKVRMNQAATTTVMIAIGDFVHAGRRSLMPLRLLLHAGTA